MDESRLWNIPQELSKARKTCDEIIKELVEVQPMDKNLLKPFFNVIEVSWDECIPFFYGQYEGTLKSGKPCIIDVDWKIKVYKAKGENLLFKTDEQVGTDQIRSWFCTTENVKSMIKQLQDHSENDE